MQKYWTVFQQEITEKWAKKVGVALSGGRHALSPQKAYFVEFYGRAAGFWLFDFYDLSRSQF